MQPNSPPNGVAQYLVPLLVVAVVVGLRLLRMRGGGSRLRLERLWIVPTVYAVFAIALFAAAPPAGLGAWAIIAAAFTIGAGVGWQRGRTIRVTIDPETHALNQRASPLTMLLIVALIAVRLGLKSLAEREGAAWHVSAALITDALVAMAVGLFALTRLELYLRGRRLLAEARRG